MCGITAFFTSNRANLERRAADALALIAPRGPDSQRAVFSHLDDAAAPYFGALCAARLAMVDVAGPNQPLETSDGRFRVALDGEIWNYRALRAELTADGVCFQTQGDTEVLLYTVAARGSGAPRTLRGQFVYVVEDTETGRIYAARDRHGIRPLFHGLNAAGDFILSSSVHVLLDNDVPATAIRILPQGYSLEYDARSGALRFERYYDLDADVAAQPERRSIDALRDHLFARIREKIPTEVPYVTIVGGIDSALATMVCGQATPRPRCTITVATDETSSDVTHARMLSEALDLECRIGLVDADYIRENLAHVIDTLASANFFEVVTSLVGLKAAQMAREVGAKAIISGGGGDELFGGYDFVWKLFEAEHVEANLRHVYLQSGTFECHREDRIISSVGIEPRPVYYDAELAAQLFSLSPEARIAGLGTPQVVSKSLLREIARGVLPDPIVDAPKLAFYKSSGITRLFEQVARELMSSEEASDWKRHVRETNPSWAMWLLAPGRGRVLIHKLFAERFPGLASLPIPPYPPDYDDPESYGAFHGSFGAPRLQGYKNRLTGPRFKALVEKSTR